MQRGDAWDHATGHTNAIAVDEARIVLEGVPDQPGVSHRVFSALAAANIAVDMIGQSAGTPFPTPSPDIVSR